MNISQGRAMVRHVSKQDDCSRAPRLDWRPEEAVEKTHAERVDMAGVSSVDGPAQRGERFGSKSSGLGVFAVNCFYLPCKMRKQHIRGDCNLPLLPLLPFCLHEERMESMPIRLLPQALELDKFLS